MSNLDHVKHAVTDIPVEPLLLTRWSPRAFSDRPVSDADITTIFTAGSWAASSYNEQPWRFILGRKTGGQPNEAYTKIFNALLPMNQAWAKLAPVLYASFAKKTFTSNGKPNKVAPHDVGAASANMSLEATSLGLYTHGMGGFDADLLRASFGVPSDFEPIACWALGYLGDPANLPENFRLPEQSPRDRKPLSAFLFNSWDSAASL